MPAWLGGAVLGGAAVCPLGMRCRASLCGRAGSRARQRRPWSRPRGGGSVAASAARPVRSSPSPRSVAPRDPLRFTRVHSYSGGRRGAVEHGWDIPSAAAPSMASLRALALYSPRPQERRAALLLLARHMPLSDLLSASHRAGLAELPMHHDDAYDPRPRPGHLSKTRTLRAACSPPGCLPFCCRRRIRRSPHSTTRWLGLRSWPWCGPR
jgi:hypothetical protein